MDIRKRRPPERRKSSIYNVDAAASSAKKHGFVKNTLSSRAAAKNIKQTLGLQAANGSFMGFPLTISVGKSPYSIKDLAMFIVALPNHFVYFPSFCLSPFWATSTLDMKPA
jgi:hypothetical protein